jgi:hypothetical protein
MRDGESVGGPDERDRTMSLADLLPAVDPIEQALELARAGRAAEKRRALREALKAYERARDLVVGLDPTPLRGRSTEIWAIPSEPTCATRRVCAWLS